MIVDLGKQSAFTRHFWFTSKLRHIAQCTNAPSQRRFAIVPGRVVPFPSGTAGQLPLSPETRVGPCEKHTPHDANRTRAHRLRARTHREARHTPVLQSSWPFQPRKFWMLIGPTTPEILAALAEQSSKSSLVEQFANRLPCVNYGTCRG